jgi:hypothetical protein
MMAILNNTRVQIQVYNVLVGGNVPKKNTGEVMTVQFSTPNTGPFDTDSRPKSLKKFQIWFHSIVKTKWGG